MSATADVAQPDQRVHAVPLPSRTPGVALALALAEYPGLRLWNELCRLLPRDAAERVFEAAEAAMRAARV